MPVAFYYFTATITRRDGSPETVHLTAQGSSLHVAFSRAAQDLERFYGGRSKMIEKVVLESNVYRPADWPPIGDYMKGVHDA